MVENFETADGKPYFNVDRSSQIPLPEKKEAGSGEEKPKIPATENPSDKVVEKPKQRTPNRRLRGVFS
jgi:hypothetical protein